MTTKHYIAGSIALFLVALPFAPIQAATFLPVSEEVASLRSEAKGDVYAASNSVVITAPVEGDIFAIGDAVDVSGSSTASVFAVGRTISLTGDTKDDVRAAGSMVSIGSQIAHDLFAAGSSVFVTKDSHVHGDAYLAGETVIVSGTIHGNLRVGASKVTITKDATVMGNVTVRGNAPVIEEGAKISGTVTTLAPTKMETREKGRFAIGGLIASMASSAILGLILLFATPALVARSKDIITKSPAQSGVIGLLWILLFLPVTILLMISGLGVYLGIFFLTITFPVSILAFGLMIIATGSMLYKAIAKNEGNIWYHAVIGAVIISLIPFLGPLGFLLLSLAFLIALGAVLKALWNMVQGK